jgi:hypothetical protein
LEDDADFFSVGIEGGDVVGHGFVVTAMARILGAVTQEVAMELADHVFRDGDLPEGIAHLIHDVGITGDLLFIPGLEFGDVQAAEQVFDLAVRELGAFDAGGGADTFNGGDLAQAGEFFRGKAAHHAPLAFELVQFRNETEHFRCDGESGREHDGWPSFG